MAGPPYSLRAESTPYREKSQLGAENAGRKRGRAAAGREPGARAGEPAAGGLYSEDVRSRQYAAGAADVAVAFVNLLATAAWFGLLVALDPNRRVKKTARALLECYLLGMSFLPLLGLLHWVVSLPLLPAYRAGATDSILFWLYDELSTGPVEELAKFLVFYLITRSLRSIKEPLDGVLQAAAVALAFASVENLLYGSRFGSVALVLRRSVISTTGHLSFAAIWGMFTACLRFGILKVEARAGWKVLAWAVLGAAVLHSSFNLLLTVGLWPFALALDAVCLLTAILFQRSLARQPLYGAEPVAQPEKTLQLLHHSWREDSDTPAVHFRLGLAYLSLGDTGSALRHLARCRFLRPGHAQVDALIGCARILAGRVDQGEELLAQAYARLDPRARWYLQRTVDRLLDRRQPGPGDPERAHRFHLRHFFLHARPRT